MDSSENSDSDSIDYSNYRGTMKFEFFLLYSIIIITVATLKKSLKVIGKTL